MALSIQQRKNLEAAVRAATTAPSASNPLVTAAEQPWEEVSNVVRVKSGFGASGCRVGTDASTATVDAQNEWDTSNVSGVTWSTDKWVPKTTELHYGDYQTSNSATSGGTNYVVTRDSIWGGNSAYEGWKAFDGNGSSVWGSAGTYPHWIAIDLLTTKTLKSVKITWLSGDYASDYVIQGSSNGTSWTTVHTVTGNSSLTNDLTFSSPESYRHFRMYATAGASTAATIYSFELYQYVIVPTTELCTGTQSFAPSSLKLYTTTAKSTELVNGEATVSFRKVIAGNVTDYGSQESLTTFRSRPASEFANCTSLFLKVAPVGAYTVGGLTINTTSSSVITTKSGAVTIAVNDVTVYAVETDGDVIATDITADDITLTGGITESSRTDSDGSVTITATDKSIIRCSYTATGAVAVALPALSGVSNGRVFTIVDAGGLAGTNNITITPNGGDTIIGDATYVMDSNDEAVTLVANTGTSNWEIR